MKILLAVDGSACTARMLECLAAYDEMFPGPHAYTVFTVIEPSGPHHASFARAGSMEDFLRDEAEAVLGPVRTFLQQRHWTVESDHVPGKPAQAIVEKAGAMQAELIVMGTHGRSALGRLLLGSVASGVLAGCKVPVLLVR